MEIRKIESQMIDEVRRKCVPSFLSKTSDFHYSNQSKENTKYLKQILTGVVVDGGSNSVLISGPCNSGKTTFVESAISEITSNVDLDSNCRVVRLDGILCPDFMSSLEELSYQLEAEEEFAYFMKTEAFAEGRTEVLAFLRRALVTRAEAVIIVLDHIELFCEHRGQALLYNLLDITHSEEKPVCVIGITTCQEIWELFEKRVKSRFGHRIIYVKPLSFDEYKNFALAQLKVSQCAEWNKNMEELLSNNCVVQVLQFLYHTDNSIGTLSKFWYNVCLHCTCDSDLTSNLIVKVSREFGEGKGVRVQRCVDLNLSELLVILGLQKLTKIGQPTFTFNGILEIVKKAGQSKGIYESDIAVAMNKLEELQIIAPVDKSRLYYRTEMDYQEMTEVSKISKLPAEFQQIM